MNREDIRYGVDDVLNDHVPEYWIIMFLVDCVTPQNSETICEQVNKKLIGKIILSRDLRRRKATA